jgi:3-methyladenine DNA glycosylase AlkD
VVPALAARSLHGTLTDVKSTPEAIADEIERELRPLGTPERAAAEKTYLKSDLEFLGATVPSIRKVVLEALARHPALGHEDVVRLAEALWAKPVNERRFAAVEVLERCTDRLGPADAGLLERLLREAKTWAYVDGLAVSVTGELVERFPELRATLDRWATDEDFWLRRSALLALLPGLRRGEGDFDRFSRYADAMLEEREFFIRKAIGWVLRETGRKRPELVYEWLRPRIHRASGVTVREAVKYLPAEKRDDLLAVRPGTHGRSRPRGN